MVHLTSCHGSRKALVARPVLGAVLRQLAPRWFVVRDTHVEGGPLPLHPRDTFSLLRGPMTRNEIRAALARTAVASPQPRTADASPEPCSNSSLY